MSSGGFGQEQKWFFHAGIPSLTRIASPPSLLAASQQVTELRKTRACGWRDHRPLRAAALSLKRLPRRMYLRTCLRDRCRVCSMMARSVAPPSVAEVARPERSECPEKEAAGRPARPARRLMILAS